MLPSESWLHKPTLGVTLGVTLGLPSNFSWTGTICVSRICYFVHLLACCGRSRPLHRPRLHRPRLLHRLRPLRSPRLLLCPQPPVTCWRRVLLWTLFPTLRGLTLSAQRQSASPSFLNFPGKTLASSTGWNSGKGRRRHSAQCRESVEHISAKLDYIRGRTDDWRARSCVPASPGTPNDAREPGMTAIKVRS